MYLISNILFRPFKASPTFLKVQPIYVNSLPRLIAVYKGNTLNILLEMYISFLLSNINHNKLVVLIGNRRNSTNKLVLNSVSCQNY